jgi:hypothetical protein
MVSKKPSNLTNWVFSVLKAFEDMSKLMEQAREMVNLSKTITERLRMKKGDDITEDEVSFLKYLSLMHLPLLFSFADIFRQHNSNLIYLVWVSMIR